MGKITFWEYHLDGVGMSDNEFPTRNAAYRDAEEIFAEEVQQNMYPRNGEEFEAELTLVEYLVNAEGEDEEITREDDTVIYQHYHGDLEEHGVWHKGGVL